ncbi:MAG: hypothetical protein IJM57_02770 [Lachnospiraceae bacterium]|nr:hypothetical protein [Lachnospiraceae bacterium]
MIRLLRNDYTRLLREISFYVVCLAAAGVGYLGVMLCPGYQAVMAYSQANLFLIPVAVVATIVYLVPEFEYGIVRNKVVAGYRRSRILASWLTVLVTMSLVLAVIYNLTVRIVIEVQGNPVGTSLKTKEFLTNNAMMVVMMLAFVVLALVVVILSEGYRSIVTALFVYFLLAAVTMLSENVWQNGILAKKIVAIIPAAHLGDSVMEVQNTLATTLIGGGIVIVLLTAAAVALFRRKNLE